LPPTILTWPFNWGKVVIVGSEAAEEVSGEESIKTFTEDSVTRTAAPSGLILGSDNETTPTILGGEDDDEEKVGEEVEVEREPILRADTVACLAFWRLCFASFCLFTLPLLSRAADVFLFTLLLTFPPC
jgi:hypothetical protein